MDSLINIKIRSAEKTDVPAIFRLICELAEFEKAPEEVINSEQQMLEDGFGENPLFKSLVAENNGKVIGFALYYYRYSTWKGKCLYLEDFYVEAQFRSLGIGKQLFDAILEKAKQENCQKLNWQVLDWNQGAINFYEKYQANFAKEWWNGYMDV